MTPTQILGASLLCTIFGLLGAVFYRGVSSGQKEGKLTEAVQHLAETVGEIRDLFRIHAGRIEEHEGRLAKLEFCLDIDGKSMGIVQDVAEIHRRRQRRRNGGES